jgi:hypothetical protein
MVGDIAISSCLSDMTSFATEWQPPEAALEACLPRKATATCGKCPCLSNNISPNIVLTPLEKVLKKTVQNIFRFSNIFVWEAVYRPNNCAMSEPP